MLTNESGMFYAESLKTATIGFRTRQICDFFVFANWRMRAENILNISQGSIVAAFSESATFHNCVAFLKKATKMTNTIINSLYSQYQQLKAVSGTDRREVLAVLDKLVNTPTTTPEDRKIKFSVGCEYVELFNQIAAE